MIVVTGIHGCSIGRNLELALVINTASQEAQQLMSHISVGSPPITSAQINLPDR
jgi:hypothetical protein